MLQLYNVQILSSFVFNIQTFIFFYHCFVFGIQRYFFTIALSSEYKHTFWPLLCLQNTKILFDFIVFSIDILALLMGTLISFWPLLCFQHRHTGCARGHIPYNLITALFSAEIYILVVLKGTFLTIWPLLCFQHADVIGSAKWCIILWPFALCRQYCNMWRRWWIKYLWTKAN